MKISYTFLRYGFVAALVVFSAIYSGCTNGTSSSQKPKGPMKFSVEVADVVTRNTEFTIPAVGSVEAFEIVPVTARVQGVVEEVQFREGDAVREGTSLVKIEPDRYQLGLQSAQAQFEKARASLHEAQSGLKRRVDIQNKQPGMVSPEELEDWQTRVHTLEADSAYAMSQLEISKLNFRDSGVPAPVNGIIQSRTVKTGQFLQTGTVIATIVRRDPLLLRFSVPEQDAKRIEPEMAVKFRTRDDKKDYTAIVTAITESADAVTRMVSVTAEVTDPEKNKLRPGSFAEVSVQLGESGNYPVVPQTSIRPSERGFIAFVVVGDSVAHERVLTLGMRSADGLVEVKNGILNGEKIVVRGAEALYENAAVRIGKVSSISTGAEPDTAKGTQL